jgi:hypothetical protein
MKTEYPKYENFDAINVDKTKDIPYKTMVILVSITFFIDKYNPDQFEIVALGIVNSIDFTSNRKMKLQISQVSYWKVYLTLVLCIEKNTTPLRTKHQHLKMQKLVNYIQVSTHVLLLRTRNYENRTLKKLLYVNL